MVPLAGTVEQLAQHLDEVLGDKEKLREFLEQTGEDAQNWLEKLQQLIDDPKLDLTSRLRSLLSTSMIRLSKRSGLHPRCLFIQNVRKLGKHPVAAGGFGDVWKGVIGQPESEEQLVCLKVSKVYMKSDLDALFKGYLHEALVWRHLKHRNVLPFLGIYYSKDDGQFCLISPWMDNGNLLQYLKATRRADVDHLVLVYDVAAGLAYLHGEKVVHGDLKGLNILITPEGRACIGDFGLSRIADTLVLKLTTSSTRATGTVRWLAREILSDDSGPTKESDVYAFACVCYEIYTTLSPFHELTNDATVMLRVLSGECPTRPTGILELGDRTWNIMEACWNPNPTSRPQVTELLEHIKSEILVRQRETWTLDLAGLRPWAGSHYPMSVSHDSTRTWDERPAKRKSDTEGTDLHTQIRSLSPLVGNTSDCPSVSSNTAFPGHTELNNLQSRCPSGRLPPTVRQ
ncbi:Rho guanine nucleotide exchange factor [Marasmius tenuissimus]|nr:Rho guanine nucleotide exchange factor [Marasmius tenuissimus]